MNNEDNITFLDIAKDIASLVAYIALMAGVIALALALKTQQLPV